MVVAEVIPKAAQESLSGLYFLVRLRLNILVKARSVSGLQDINRPLNDGVLLLNDLVPTLVCEPSVISAEDNDLEVRIVVADKFQDLRLHARTVSFAVTTLCEEFRVNEKGYSFLDVVPLNAVLNERTGELLHVTFMCEPSVFGAKNELIRAVLFKTMAGVSETSVSVLNGLLIRFFFVGEVVVGTDGIYRSLDLFEDAVRDWGFGFLFPFALLVRGKICISLVL